MTVTRRLQLSMTALVMLGTLLLGLGQPSPTMPLLAVFATLTSLLFTDILQWFHLNRILANLAAVAAAVFSLWNFFRDNSQEQLLAIANLLSILLIILLYQQKNDRLYWQLAVLSLLQVVVAAALNLGLMFGVLVVLYTLVAIAVLAVFFLAREANRLCAVEATAAPLASSVSNARRTTKTNGARARSGRIAAIAAPPIAFQPVENLFEQSPFAGRSLAGQIASLGGMTLVFAMILFYCVPRVGPVVWQGPPGAGQRQAGFSQQITLEQMGEILQNRDLVMRASFSDLETGAPYRVETPYFRGAVLYDYYPHGESAQWNQLHPTSLRGGRLRAAQGVSRLVRQDIAFASTAVSTDPVAEPPPLFSVYPFYPVVSTPESVGSSRVDLQACKLEYSIVSPK